MSPHITEGCALVQLCVVFPAKGHGLTRALSARSKSNFMQKIKKGFALQNLRWYHRSCLGCSAGAPTTVWPKNATGIFYISLTVLVQFPLDHHRFFCPRSLLGLTMPAMGWPHRWPRKRPTVERDTRRLSEAAFVTQRMMCRDSLLLPGSRPFGPAARPI